MDPITLALLGSTAVSGIGSLLGASSAGDTAAANRQIAQQNYAAQSQESARRQQEFEQAMRFAQQQYGDAQQGMTTAQGSSVRFVPGQGWVSTLGPVDAALQARNIRAGGAADALMREFMSQQPISGERMSQLLYEKAIRGLNDRFGGQMAQGMQYATRRSNPQLAAATAAAIGKQQGEEFRNAAIDSEIAGRKYATETNQSNRNALANLIAAFSGQAAGEVGPNKYIPGLASNASGAGKNLLVTAMSNNAKAPTLAPEQADTSFGSALASLGQLGYGAAKDYASTQRQNQYLDALTKKYNTGWNTGV